jgi:HD-GYP domain-containing protein (c-di-GMP phosphodiesterase class II)
MPPQEITRPEDKVAAAATDHDSVGEKLLREAELIGGGLKKGVSVALEDAWENKGESGLKIGVSAALGAGLALMSRRAGVLQLGAQIAGVAFTVSFAREVAARGSETWGAMKDTWDSPENLERNKTIVAGSLGPLVVDTGLMTAGGAMGAGIARIPSVERGFDRSVDYVRNGFKSELTPDNIRFDNARLNELFTELKKYHPDTGEHSVRVAQYSELIAEQMKLPADQRHLLKHGAALHDVGKLDVPLEILNSTGKLTLEQRFQIEKHAKASHDRLAAGDLPGHLKELPGVAGAHHENFDGSGYYKGLAENQIPQLSRIVTVADNFDAMSSSRSYKGRTDINWIHDYLLANKGKKFDPAVVDAFMQVPAERIAQILGKPYGHTNRSSFKPFSGQTWGQFMESMSRSTTQPSALQKAFMTMYTTPKGH